MILHPIIDLLKRIVVALPDYAGGGGDHTVIDVITIPNGTVNELNYGVINGFFFELPNTIAKIDIVYKNLLSTGNCVWICSSPITKTNSIATQVPYIDNQNASSGGTLITNETIDGYTHLTMQLTDWTTRRFRVGSWMDNTYSKPIAIKSLKTWDSNGNIMNSFIPVIKNNDAMFYDEIVDMYYENWNGLGFIQGEAVIA